MRCFRLIRVCIVCAAAVSTLAGRASATVIFQENFAARATGSGVFGSQPNVTNTGGAVYVKGDQLATATQGTIGHFGDPSLGVKGLRFQPMDPENTPPEEQKAGSWGQNMAVPFNYTFGTNPVRLTLVARQPAVWNNFIFGFTDQNQVSNNFLLLQPNPNPPNFPDRVRLQLWHNGSSYNRNYPPGIDTNYFRELVLEYDPTKASTPDVNPYSFFVDGLEIPLSANAVNLPPMTSIGGIGWGFWFADGNVDRSVLIQSMKFEVLDAPSTPQGDFNGDGKVDAADYVVWRKGPALPADYTTWRQNFGVGTSGAGSSAVAAVPELTSGALVMIGLLTGVAASRRRVSSRPMAGS